MKHFLLLFFFFTAIGINAQEKIWTTSITDVEFMNQIDNGHLLLKGKTNINIIDHKTGNINFRLDIKTNNQPLFLDGLPLFFVEGSPFVMVEYESGHIIEKSKENTEVIGITTFKEKGRVVVEMKRSKKFYVLNIDLNDINLSWTTLVGNLDKKAVFPLSQPGEFPPLINPNGDLIIRDEKNVYFLDLFGNLISQQSNENNIPINNSTELQPIEFNTVSLNYENIPEFLPPSDFLELATGIGYIYKTGKNYEFNVINKEGNILWNKRFGSSSRPIFYRIGHGVLVFDGSRIKYLSASNGESLWDKDMRITGPFTSRIDEETKDLYMYFDKHLYRFDYATGLIARSEDKLRFKNFNYQLQSPQLRVLKDAIFLKGSNTINILNKDGTLRHTKNYESTYSNSIVLDVRQNQGSMVFPYVLTQIGKGKLGLIFINPSSGEERFKIPIECKNCYYIVDEYDGFLFLLKDRELIAYNLK